MKSRRTTNQHCSTDFDIEAQVLEIISLLQQHNLVTIQYVEGHQDKNQSPNERNFAAKLNIAAHNLSTLARTTAAVTYYDFPTATASFYIYNDPIYANSANSGKIAKRYYHNIAPKVFFHNKYNWTESTSRSVWWQPQVHAINKLSISERVNIQKFMHNRLSTRTRETFRYKFKCNKCAHCKHEIVEDEKHII